MKTIVVCCPNASSFGLLCLTLDHLHAQAPITQVITTADHRNADILAGLWGLCRAVPVEALERTALLTAKTIRKADQVVVFWDRKSRVVRQLLELAYDEMIDSIVVFDAKAEVIPRRQVKAILAEGYELS